MIIVVDCYCSVGDAAAAFVVDCNDDMVDDVGDAVSVFFVIIVFADDDGDSGDDVVVADDNNDDMDVGIDGVVASLFILF